MAADDIPGADATDTRTPHVAAFAGADDSRVAHYMLPWDSTRGEPRPWNETASAMIGADGEQT